MGGACGTNTSAIAAGGGTGPTNLVNNAETYNGSSSWTETTEMNTARMYIGSLGQSSTAALAADGYTSSNVEALTEPWNGSAWTEVGDSNTTRRGSQGVGTSTSGRIAGGITTATVANAESWNNTSWTAITALSQARYGAGGSGTVSDGIIYAGAPGVAKTEHYDGSSWTELSDL